MSLYSDRPDRYVIPRWRGFKKTCGSNELNKQVTGHSPKVPKVSCEPQLQKWKDNPSVGNTLELINSAFISGQKEHAMTAAHYIIENCKDQTNPIFTLANSVLNTTTPQRDQNEILPIDRLEQKIQVKIHLIRNNLRSFAHNPVLWVDLARWYTVIGKINNAERCVKTAISLAPTNPFVIRSAVRFFIHKAKYDYKDEDSLGYALQLIRTNPATKSDPWLMATEISLTSYIGKVSRLIKTGLSLIESQNHSLFTLSELTSAIATVELKHSGSKSRKLFNQSLCDPNENSIAQAHWAKNKVGGLPIELNQYNTNSFEARAFEKQLTGDWKGAFDDTLNWLIDEPFSSAPANQASYLAGSIVDNNIQAIRICDFGLKSNPNEFILLNNKAYSQAIEGYVGQAEKTFSAVQYGDLSIQQKVVYMATSGLIQFRKGNTELGHKRYFYAESLALKNGDESKAFMVQLYRTRTEFICGVNTIDSATAFANLERKFEKFKSPINSKIMDNLKDRLGLKPNEKGIVPISHGKE